MKNGRGSHRFRADGFATADDFFQHVSQYYESEIRDAATPAFLAADNEHNVVYGGDQHQPFPVALNLSPAST